MVPGASYCVIVATDPSLDVRFPIAKVPALKNHFGMSYKLLARVSVFKAGALDIIIRFEDGYAMLALCRQKVVTQCTF
jgi:hypothetical protein